MSVIVEQLGQQVGVSRACEVLNVSRSQVYRARHPKQEAKRRSTPVHALSEEERINVREVLNSERFMDKAPRQVYATLLDEGIYVCHWRTMYRILTDHDEVRERRNVRQHPVYKKPELLATSPNQVWSWDISALRGSAKWVNYPLYTVLDIYSRYVVGWMITEVETSEFAKQLIAEITHQQEIQTDQLILHADNGAPMRGKPLSQLLVNLGIARSHNHPYTSDDNPFSEAQFKTMKFRPDDPDRFDSLTDARRWARCFFDWYNHQHYHSGLNLLTPASVHYGQADTVKQQRQTVMSAAYLVHPTRFAKGEPIVKGAPKAVYINPPQEVKLL
jgi:putative transposase